ncbi:1-phosphatidylinositol 4,5-bisphosphate phosphodiesterase eta-2 isoform X2 [Sceloporus undulatus]|uniref:1-phosphatidylinositol 4,5-bisphosphate phosphodiesterase eta-2 isoform X2 n=1 Tax=Sceloporus undulatus TaxID=8520 RepID=UPI001C4A797D|nr:1-phosphatidylinositol 4,5-bisphosphate phosphodiesterase eta-2 isoform X2 [Sceloporus undulatus]
MLADLRQPEDASCGSAHCQYFLSRNDVIVVEKCMSSMQAGTQMIKLRGSSKGLVRFYYLDEHKSCIRWRPSRKNEKAKISIDSIQEVCEGKQSEIFQRYADGSFDPNCCFSIYYGDHMESLDLVSSSGEEARTWITGLKYLMAGISDEDSLSKRQRTRDQWLKQTFDEADKNGDGSLSINEVLQLMHKLNVNLPRQKVKQMFKEADTDDNQGTLDFEEFCAFYKMMSTRRDLYLLMLTYSNHKDYLDVDDLRRFLDSEQKMCSVNKDHCLEIINQFEPCPENRKQGALGIDGFTNYMRSPAGDIFNPEHYQVNQDMTRPLSHYFITSSHNTYLMGDQLMSQSRVDMYAWVLQSGCRCVEVDCWDGPDGEPIVHHGYTLTSKILFKDVIETINKYAFIRSEYPVILSIENHCSVAQQKKMAQYLTEILGDKLDLSSVSNGDPGKLPSPESLKGKILVKGKKLPANISEDVEEGEVSDEDSADEMEDDCKLMNGDASTNRKRVENIAKKKLDSLIKESKIRDCEDPNNFTVATLPPSGKLGNKHDLKKNKHEEDVESGQDAVINKRHNRSLMGSFSKRKKKGSKLKRASSLEDGEDDLNCQGNIARGSVHYSKTSRQKKTMKLSRALSDLVKYTKSVGIHDVESEISSSWQVSSFSETKAHQILQQKPAQYLRFNQHQLSRIYPSSYRVDSSNYNPQPFWNAGCQLVALNYQSEGRMLQLNRAKFNANGNCGYVLKPTCMCQGTFNPNSEDPLLGQMKKQLVLRIISGQQLPKPRDSMLGDRGEIIDPFVEVEIIGLPVDCCKEQTRVVDDNGFNPMWEETLVFSICMPEITLVRFLVWDHDPIGRDFIGQRTISFTSMMPGYRHVYLEGMEEASIFVHVAVNDICGKVKQALGLKGLFLRSPKQASLDSHAAGQLNRKDSFSSHLLRRTASAPTKTQKKTKKGFPEIVIDAKDNGSEGTSEDHEFEDSSHPRFDQEPECASPALSLRDGAHREAQGKGLKDVHQLSVQKSIPSLRSLETISEEPFVANENQPPGSCFPFSTTLPTDSKEGNVPDNSHETALEGDGLSDQLERVSLQQHAATDVEEKIFHAPGPALAKVPEWENSTSEEESRRDSWERMHGGGNLPTSQTQDNVALANHWLHSARNCQKQRDRTVQELGSAERREKGSATKSLPPHQSKLANDSIPIPPQEPPEVTQAATDPASHLVVKRSKSEGCRLCDCSVSMRHPGGFSLAAEVYSDVTANDHIWSKLDSGTHRDSMSSSSSMSSNDTVIDLSLPSLARKSLPDLVAQHENVVVPARRGMRPWSANAVSGHDIPMVSKSKSNPNLRSDPPTEDVLCPRPLARGCKSGSVHRRHTWSRLYMESLRQSYLKSKGQENAETSQVKSKSLGDLTSEDITCTFDSKYRRISRGFITQSMREQCRCAVTKVSAKPPDELTERLKRLTTFQQEDDITSPTSLEHVESEEDEEGEMGLLRRASSRSQSRVRYIANRAKQAQERQRLKSLTLGQGSPIEERGNPEGACCFAGGACTDTACPSLFTSQYKNQTVSNPDPEVVFLFKL